MPSRIMILHGRLPSNIGLIISRHRLNSFESLAPGFSHAAPRPQHMLPFHGRRSRKIHTTSSAMRQKHEPPPTPPEHFRVSYSSIPNPNPPERCLKLRLILPSKRTNTFRDVYCRPEHTILLRGERVNTPLLKFLPEEHSNLYKETLARIRSQTSQFPIGLANPEIFENTGSGPYTVFTIKPSEQMLEVYEELRRSFKGIVDTPEFKNFSLGCKIRIGIAKQPLDEARKTVKQLNKDFPNGVDLGMVQGLNLVHRCESNGISIFKSSYFLRKPQPSDTEDTSPFEAASPTSPPFKPENREILAPKPTAGRHLGWERI